MKVLCYVIVLVSPLLLVGGCETFRDAVQKISVDPAVTSGTGDEVIPPVNLDTFSGGPCGAKPCYSNPLPTKEMRTYLQERIIARSVIVCDQFTKDLFAAHVARSVGLDSIALLLTGAAAAVGGETAKTALAAAGAGTQGISRTIDTHALQEKTITAITNAISEERKKMRSAMAEKVNTDIAAYSMTSAVIDALEYHQMCSLTQALSVLGTAVKDKINNEETIKEIKINLTKVELEKAMADLTRLPAETPQPVRDALENRIKTLEAEQKKLKGL